MRHDPTTLIPGPGTLLHPGFTTTAPVITEARTTATATAHPVTTMAAGGGDKQ
ncbi:hypothetical protein [Fibrella forsythiae]|uniref:Uncharacterized protein n=1 Tax=Fibrella forsythiae TaxID=2817061 RepID=A0ABS3JKL3_9BACT|nr:hypothetical protein [Fibrella forsythiae]MBO0950535.1 hypothetical protein [Fibrella forsythiae]